MDCYRTLGTARYQHEITVSKSRFIATVGFAADVVAAQKLLAQVIKEHPHASHHCYAYLTTDGQKSSDDGEPSGTAGVPIRQAIQTQSLYNVVVVVTRYFGGVKLGTGGLARAYGQAATTALTYAPRAVAQLCTRVVLTVPYEQAATVVSLTERYGSVEHCDYTAQVQLQLAIPVGQRDAWWEALPVTLREQIKVIDPAVWVTVPATNA